MSNANICYLDFETSGLLPWKHGVIQMGYILETIPEGQYKGTVLLERRLDMNLLPTDEFDPGSSSAHGKIESEVRNNPDRMEARDAVDIFKQDLWNTFGSQPVMLCGYNVIKFDEEFLRKLLAKTKGGAYYKLFFSPSIDVLAIYAHLVRFNRIEMKQAVPKGTMTQGTLERILIEELEAEGYKRNEQLHDALVDINLTRYLYILASKNTLWNNE